MQLDALSISIDPVLPLWALSALGGLSVLIVIASISMRARGSILRSLAIVTVWLMLLDPSVVAEQREALTDIAVVVVDESASNRVGDRAGQTDAALLSLRSELDALPNLEVRIVRSGGGGQGVSAIDRAADGTHLFDALDKALADVPRRRLAGTVMITDGLVHDVPETVPPEMPPTHVLLTGDDGDGDRRLTVVEAPGFGLVGREISITLRIDDLAGSTPSAVTRAPVTIMKNGVEVERTLVPIGREATIDVTLDHAGETIVELITDEGPQELSLTNNRAVLSINGVRERLRVLLVSGEPHAGERTWRSLLKADPSVDLVHFTILRPPEKQDGTPIRELSLIAFPIRELFEVKLDEFDLIIFDRYRRRGVVPQLYLNNIAQYVLKGGALLEAAGPNFASPLTLHRTPLGVVLPGRPTGTIFEQGFQPWVTDTGHRHPVTAGLPGANPEASALPSGPADDQAPEWGRWFRHIDVEATSGETLMTGIQGKPLLILDRVGEGRVAQVMSDHMWLWSRGYEGGGPQAELLRRIAHWLMKEPDLEENDLRATVRGEEIEIIRRSLETGEAAVIVTAPSGKTERLPLEDAGGGRAIARFRPDELGLYRADDGDRIALAAVGPLNPREFADLRSSDAALAPVVAATGGAVFRIGSVSTGPDGPVLAATGPDVRMVAKGRDTSGRNWMGLVRNDASTVTGVREISLLPPLLALVLALGLLLMAWRREGR